MTADGPGTHQLTHSRLWHACVMFRFRIRGRRWWLVAIAAALLGCLLALSLRTTLEQAARTRIESAAARHGMVVRIGLVHVGLWPLLRLEGFDLDLGHGARFHADMITATWPGRLRLAVRAAALAGPAGVRITSPDSAWDVSGVFGEDLRLALTEPQAGLSIRKLASPVGSTWNVEARALEVGRLLDVRRDDQPMLDGGIADGGLGLQVSTDALRFHVDMGARGARLAALADNDAGEPQLGDPTDVTLRFDGVWKRAGGTVEMPEVHATLAGAALAGSLALRDLDTDPVIDLDLGVQRLDFAQLLGTSGLALPEGLELAPGSGHDLGSATIEVQVSGHLAEPASLSVSQKIEFRPPPRFRRESGVCVAISSSAPMRAPGRTTPSTSRPHPRNLSPCETFRRCSCALFCLPKTWASTGIAA